MAIADPVVMPLAREMLACFEQEIAKVANPPMYTGLRAGTSVDHLISMHENECACGSAWVRVVSFSPSSTVFPTQDEVPQPKGTASWAIVLELGAVRCSPTPDADRIPTVDEWDNVVQAIMDDGAAMRRAICCFIESARGRTRRVLPGQWTPAPIEGGCVGGVMTVTIQGPACDCENAGPAPS